MKKIYLLMLLQLFMNIVMSFTECHAQERFSVGVSSQMLNTRLVVNLTNLQTKGAYRPSINVFSEYNFGRKYALHAGLGYTMMTQNSDAFKNNFHYLAMPVYFKIGRIKDGNRFAFTSFYGTNLHYLIKADHIFLDETKNDIMDQCRKFHFDLTIGTGLKYKLSDSYTLEALYSLSLGTMINKYNAAYTDINNLNSGFIINLSYKIK